MFAFACKRVLYYVARLVCCRSDLYLIALGAFASDLQFRMCLKVGETCVNTLFKACSNRFEVVSCRACKEKDIELYQNYNANKVVVLLHMDYDIDELGEGLYGYNDLSNSTCRIEQGHVSGSVLKRSHARMGMPMLISRAFVHMCIGLLTAQFDDVYKKATG